MRHWRRVELVKVMFKDGTELIMSEKEFDRGMNRGIGWFEYNNKRYKLDLLKGWKYVQIKNEM